MAENAAAEVNVASEADVAGKAHGADEGKPLVGIVMGSDSDWNVMIEAAKVLDEFGIPYEASVVSAHRMPEDMVTYGRAAASRGLRVIIAGAGGAAHYRRTESRAHQSRQSGERYKAGTDRS